MARWEVFKKDNARKPYQAVGSVHAADPEHALHNAKNVFVRRPAAVSLWVAPVSAIFSRSAEEIDNAPLEVATGEHTVPFTIFRKSSNRRSMTFMDHVGEVLPVTAESALARAIEQYSDKAGLAWWVIPTSAITSSEDGVEEAWFAPAATKTYKQQSQYGFVSKLREGRKGAVAKDE